MALVFGQDHGAIAWSHFTSVLQTQPTLSPVIQSLFAPMSGIDAAMQQLTTLWDIDTMVGAQLDGIGSIVGQARTVSNALYLVFFGYDGQPGAAGYGQAPYRYGNEVTTTNVTLADPDYRTLLRLKIAINNGHGTVAEIIAACQTIFQTQSVTVTETGVAAIRVNIGIEIDQTSRLFYDALSFIPRAAGVAVTVVFAGDT